MQITVKGWGNGLLLQLPAETPWDELRAALDAKMNEAQTRSFWRGAQTTLDFGARPLANPAHIADLLDHLRTAFELAPVAVIAADEPTRRAAETLTLAAYETLPVPQRPAAAPPAEIAPPEKPALPPVPVSPPVDANANALYIPGTVRSGQRIVHNGNVLVAGDVNAGAEIIAGGDVVVFGTLRGLAHAGSGGNESARILAGSLRPQQIRIASKIARAPGDQKNKPGDTARTAEIARIENGEIQVFPY